MRESCLLPKLILRQYDCRNWRATPYAEVSTSCIYAEYTNIAGCEENTYRLYNEMFVKKIDEFKKRSTEKNDA